MPKNIYIYIAVRSGYSTDKRRWNLNSGKMDYGRFVPMHFRSRERNDQSEYAYSNFRALERLSEPNEEKE